MATSKLLKPTNVTISIPEFTDQPDQRVNSNCIDKSADAINTLSEHIGTFETKRFSKDSSGTDRNTVLHTWMADIHTTLQVGEVCCMTGIFQSTMYYGIVAKVTSNVLMGHMFAPNSASGFYFRDGKTDTTATSTNFSM